ncbi:translocation/assembly module TamB domain-containing protein [Desertivirga brevis]|uniref:translocation/assembly module TamB domain-containing protein n=1 Tax=Desertivirga brevis TaxID=2810310 RepID=UPI001F613B05|nr:translocation/assembly module TamB domain-containing protein [Pedobacter sp. SYSU D00873]
MKNYGILSLKILLWIVGIILFLVMLVFVLIEVPAVQNFARGKAVNFLQNKIGTKVEINRLSLDLPKLIVLEDVYFEDQQRDTLLAGDTLKVDISLLKLMKNTVEINEIDLRGVTANISRTPDSVFNFDYILKAFVSEQKKPQPVDTAAAPMKFSVDKINLDRIRVKYKDAPTANDVKLYLGHFDTRVKEFDMEKSIYNIPKFTLSNVNAVVIQGKPAVQVDSKVADVAEAQEPIDMTLALGEADLDRIKVVYRNAVSALDADVNLGKLNVKSDKLDLKNKVIDLGDINLDNSTFKITLGKKVQAEVVKKEVKENADAASDIWKFTSDNINFANNNLRFDDQNLPRQRVGMDYGHLDIRNLNLSASNFVYAIDTISGKINSGSMRDKSGFNLKRLTTNFFYGKNNTYLKDLYVQTSQTVIRDEIQLAYPSIESLSTNPGDLRVDANLRNSRLGLRDVLIFVPALAATEPFKSHSAEILNINSEVHGLVKNLSIPVFQVSGFGSTTLNASGKITGLPDMNKAVFDINIKNFNTRSRDIYALVPRGTIPPNVHVPDAIRLVGTFKGSMNSFNTNLNLNSSDGSAKAVAFVKNGSTVSYKADVRTYNLNVGRIIRQEKTMGRVSMVARVDASGTDPKQLNGTFSGRVVQAQYNRYNYRNLTMKGRARNGAISAVANMADPNINFDLVANANFSKKYPAIKMTLNVDSLNLQKLNFMAEDFRFRGKLEADLPTADVDYLNGNIRLTDAIMVRSGQRIQVDSVHVTSTASADSNSLHVRSDVLSADVRGKYKLTQVGPAIQSVINKYYNTGTVTARTAPDQHLQFNARLMNGPLVQQFAPQIKELATVNMSGSFDGRTGQLTAQGTAPRIIYGGYDLSNLNFNVDTRNEAINYSVALNRLNGSSFQLLNTSVTGNIQDNILSTRLEVRDAQNRQNYLVAGALKAMGSNYEFSLNTDGLVLNQQRWNVSDGNFIRFGSQGVMAQNFVISNAGQSLSLNTTPPGINNPLAVTFSNFKIETLTEIARKDSLLIGGTINGNALVRNFQTSPIFTSDLTIGDLNFRGDTVGNIALQVNNESANTLAANMNITGKGNDVRLNGFYYINNSSFDMNLNIANLDLRSIQGFTMGNLKDASGSLNGRMSITGTTADPNVIGDLNFNNTAFRIGMLNSLFRINDERIRFNEDGIRFDNFAILDSAGNNLTVDGALLTSNYLDYRFNLDVTSDNFQALNSTAKDNEMYYGQLFIDTRLRIRGDMNAPVVDGNLKVLKATRLTLVLPQSDPGIEEREGVVEFVDLDNPENGRALTSNLDSAKTSPFTGMDINTNIEVDKEAEFSIIVDQGTGDFLRVRGQAQLNAGIDPSGKINLTGNYVLDQGAYELSYNFIKRRFDIRSGSTITWNGDPTMADVDVTAVYVAETAPLDLVANQLGSAPPSEVNQYKQRLPFELLLSLKGELMKPQISFDIDLPERNYNVSSTVVSTVNTRLDQLKTEPSELNKQAFALVLLNRFVSDNPFSSSSGGSSPESLARQSVSKLLNDQLNDIAGNLIGGVNLSFNLESTDDYTTGELKNRTDLNVTASKQLLNDRINVSIGSNFELEGPRQPRQSSNNVAGDIAVDYLLSRDGRYKLRAYRRNQYQVAVEGQVIETGLGFIINLDYNKFKEILRRKTEEEKQRQEQEKAERKLAADE